MPRSARRILSPVYLPASKAAQVDRHQQSVWQRARADTARYANTAALRFGFLGAPIAGAVAALASLLSTGQPWWFAVLAAIAASLVAWAVTAASVLLFALVRAPLRQRDEARQDLITTREALEAKVEDEEVSAAALLLRTELRDIQRKVANVAATIAGHTYPDQFAFPGEQWSRYGELLADRDPTLYAVLERAYSKSHRANEMINLRRTRASGGHIGRADEEDLPGVRRLAGEAIAALNERIGDSPQDAYRENIIARVEKSRTSFHQAFDNWQSLLTLSPPSFARG